MFKVWHFDHERHYAMKLLLPGQQADAAIREFQTGQRLEPHDNIARTIWMDRLPGPDYTPYVLSEYIEGESLEPYCSGSKTLSLGQVRDIGLQLLDALAAMHPKAERIAELSGRTLTDAEAQELMELRHKGILHRDVKPANILLDAWTGKPKLIDFNIAAHVQEANGFGGTPRYWARDRGLPEWRPDADLLSLGLVLYELVTHQHPYPNANPDQGDPLDPRELARGRRGLSEELAQFLLKAVQPTRDQRFALATEMRLALEAVPLLHAPAKAAAPPPGTFPGIELADGERGKANHNPYVTRLLSLYSQARRTNAGTRGLDEIARLTYVPTRMDHVLAPAILDGQFRLVVITGNAGDGKTAFLQQLEQHFASLGAAVCALPSGNGAEWSFGEVDYRSNYDGSQDEGDTDNDEVLAELLAPFAGASLAGLRSSAARLIAINEGRLRDFLHHSPKASEFPGLRDVVEQALGGAEAPPEGFVLVNLNLRALASGGDESLIEGQLRKMLTDQLWAPCARCELGPRCPIKHNADTLRDPAVGPEVRRRLRRLFEVVQLRRRQHLTMRDLRSVLAWVLLRDHSCDDIARLLSAEGGTPDDLARLYYFDAFAPDSADLGTVQDRAVRLLQETDVGRLESPTLDRRLYHHPDSAAPWMGFESRSDYEQQVLSAVRAGTIGVGETPDVRATLLAQRTLMHRFRRRAYFERRDDGWEGMLPYRSLALMERTLGARGEEEARAARLEARDRIVEAVSLLEGVRHPTVRRQHLCLRATRTRNASVLSFRLFPKADFEVVVDEPAAAGRFVETRCSSFRLVSKPELGNAEMRVSLDLLEMLELIRSGHRPTPADMRGMFVNLLIFRNALLHLPHTKVLVTQDGERFYEVAAELRAGGLALRLEPRSTGDLGGTP